MIEAHVGELYMILVFIGAFILLYSFVNYKKAFMWFLIYQIFWYYNATLFSIAGKTITASTGFTLAFFIIYFFKNRKYSMPRSRIPFFVPLLCIGLSTIATCFTSLAGFTSELTRSFSTVICPNIIVIWLAWQMIETKEDFKYLFKLITIVMCFACLFGLIEYFTKVNIIFNMKQSLAGGGLSNYNTSSNADAVRRGYRLLSVFEHPVGAGMCFGLYFGFVVTILVKEKIPFRKLALLTALLCLPCVVFTKMRSAMVFTVIACVGFINLKNKKTYKILALLIVCVIIAWPLVSDQMTLILSIVNSKYQSSVGGSTIEMRLSQLEAVSRVMRLSPVAGLGESFSDYINSSLTEGTLSYESIWFEQMAKHGMLGVIANVVLMFYSIVVIPSKYESKDVRILAVAYWITYTITCVPSFRIHLLYLAYFYHIKMSEVYNREYLPPRRIVLRIGTK